MVATRFAEHLLVGDHASRPAANAVPEGTLYSCTDHDLVYQSDTSTWSTWATIGGGSSDLDAIIAASSGQDIADALAGAAAPDSGNVFATMADVGGGSSIAYPALKAANAPVDDDFTSTLSGWTAVSTNGSFSTATCLAQTIDGSHLFIPYYAQNGFLYQSASNVDQEWIAGGLVAPTRLSDMFYGIALLDTSNNGVGLIYHSSDNTCALIGIASGVYTASPAAQITANNYGTFIGSPTKLWLRLTRVGNTWDGFVSLDGVNWNDSTNTVSSTFTVARKAIGSFGITASAFLGALYVDWVKTV